MVILFSFSSAQVVSRDIRSYRHALRSVLTSNNNNISLSSLARWLDPAYFGDSPTNISLFLQTSIAWNIHKVYPPPPLLTTAGFRLRSCLPIANFFVKLILHEMRTSTILSGKNYPLFLRQILHEIFMVRVDSIAFGQRFGDGVYP